MSSIEGNPWQEEEQSDKIAHLLDTGLMSDCCFLVGEDSNTKLFKLHKIILISASPVFEAMFCGNFREGQCTAEPIPIPDAQPDVFRLFLEFIYDMRKSSFPDHKHIDVKSAYQMHKCNCSYCDDGKEFISHDIETLEKLLLLANKYMIKPLQNHCVGALNIIANDVDEENLLKIFVLALNNKQENVAEYSVQLFADKFRLVNSKVLYDLDASNFAAFIKYLKDFPSSDVLKILEEYVEKNNLIDDKIEAAANKTRDWEILKEIYCSMNFFDMTLYSFTLAAKKPGLSKCLSDKRKYEIIALLSEE